MHIKGSETEKNLYRTFAGESRARTKYSFYAEKARCEGYRYIAEIFDEVSDNEKAHAREAYKRYLNKVGDTCENLLDAVIGESEEVSKVYKQFEETACKEGFKDIEKFYKELREVEESHCIKFKKLRKLFEEDKVYKRNEESLWQCMNCGYIHVGKEAPEHCPLCKYPRGYFKPYCKVE